MGSTRALFIIIIALILLATSAHSATEYQIGIGGAGAHIVNPFGPAYDKGVSCLVGVNRDISSRMTLGLRAEYHFFPLTKPASGLEGGDASYLLLGTELRMNMASLRGGLIPYLIADLGFCRADFRDLRYVTPNPFGANEYIAVHGYHDTGLYLAAGGGFRLGKLDVTARFVPSLPGYGTRWFVPVVLTYTFGLN